MLWYKLVRYCDIITSSPGRLLVRNTLTVYMQKAGGIGQGLVGSPSWFVISDWFYWLTLR